MTHCGKRRKWTPLNIVLMVLGFIVFWPLGLAMLVYILWGDDLRDTFRRAETSFRSDFKMTPRSSGNRAFDEYRDATLKRLEEEQKAFSEFLENLRHARDKEEFDRFMAERAKA